MYFKELGLRKIINNHPGSSKIIRKIRYLRFCSICDSLKTFFPQQRRQRREIDFWLVVTFVSYMTWVGSVRVLSYVFCGTLVWLSKNAQVSEFATRFRTLTTLGSERVGDGGYIGGKNWRTRGKKFTLALAACPAADREDTGAAKIIIKNKSTPFARASHGSLSFCQNCDYCSPPSPPPPLRIHMYECVYIHYTYTEPDGVWKFFFFYSYYTPPTPLHPCQTYGMSD